MTSNPRMQQTAVRLAAAACTLALAACQTGPKQGTTQAAIDAELARVAAAKNAPPPLPAAVSRALLPPVAATLPAPVADPRFDLVVSNASPQQVYQAIASGSRYSILLPSGPGALAGSVTVSLKDVTVREALETLRELYGYEYRIDGARVFVQGATLATRVFQVAFPAARRTGRSDTRVVSGGITASANAATGAPAAGGATTQEGSQVSTTNDADFWKELEASIKAVVGGEAGRSVVLSPATGVVVVRALPRELREVEQLLKTARVAVERQVMLEAKIVEVTLRDGFESGINWAAFDRAGNHRWSAGGDPSRVNVPGSLGRAAGIPTGSIVTGVDASTDPPTVVPTTLGQLITSPFASGSAAQLGVAFTSNSFAALLAFLETQGNVHVLSSPRVAATNNQKAVLRVGTDDFFITNVSTTTTASASGNVTTPSIQVQPFFSGISLDVTPQIDDDGMVMLHIRPSVSEVSERTRVVNLGNLGSFTLPLASSSVNETDTVVRVADGVTVAVGGLMSQMQSDGDARVPGAGDVPVVGNLFKRTQRSLAKRELVFLLKPTVIRGDEQWRADVAATAERMRAIQPRPERMPMPAIDPGAAPPAAAPDRPQP